MELITRVDDPRLAPYRTLKERELARDEGGLFIAEGEHLVRRLIESDFAVDSLFLSDRRVEEILPLAPGGVRVYVAPDALMHEIVGFKFHSGVIAAGRRKARVPLDSIVSRPGPMRLMILPEIANNENLGSLIRIAAGFGLDAVVLGERSCDPFFRRTVRVSMGAVFRIPIVQSEKLLDDLHQLRERWNVELAATVLDANAELLQSVKGPTRFGLVLGNEAQGLAREHIAACDRRITIPMKLGTDSLNVAVAAGIFLYHFCEGASRDPQ